ncbi:MAG: D-tyrosyl-tRNA(Tyr) deacylase [Bifidobacteriaceae bacterium]|jgi:D-tyrosyl-tRNA(Tyr) deacylase|nr:D-tyrosyl-tRNA(Tyr) deacylase [Bifidobacteriaceae bacterium]
MRAVVQRVLGARCQIAGRQVSGFDGEGLVALLGVTHADGAEQALKLARKIAELKLLRGERSALDAAAPVMAISQFTLYADTKKGRKPSWSKAAPGTQAEPLVERVALALEERGLVVARGVFGADMRITFTNDGPVTIIIDT